MYCSNQVKRKRTIAISYLLICICTIRQDKNSFSLLTNSVCTRIHNVFEIFFLVVQNRKRISKWNPLSKYQTRYSLTYSISLINTIIFTSIQFKKTFNSILGCLWYFKWQQILKLYRNYWQYYLLINFFFFCIFQIWYKKS